MCRNKFKNIFKELTRKPKVISLLSCNNLYLYNGEIDLYNGESNLIEPCILEEHNR